MIVKNVENVIEKALSSIVPFVDEVVIVDTGSSDGTKDAIRRAAPHARIYDFNQHTHPHAFLEDVEETWPKPRVPPPFSGKWMLSDFGAARQFGLEKCTGKYMIWIDSDDVVVGGENLKDIIADIEANQADSAMLNYDYAHDPRGNPTCKLVRERIVRLNGKVRWQQPIHEVVGPIGRGKFYETVNIKHQRAEYGIAPEVAHRNLKVLYKWAKDVNLDETPIEKIDPRMLFYLAMEERFVFPDLAIKHFNQYCRTSGWDEERGVAHLLAGIVHEHHGRWHEAFAEYAQAALEAYWNPDALFGAARISYFKKDWNKCIEFTERGFEIFKKEHTRKSVLMHDPLDRLYRPYVYYSAALVETCQMKKAIEACDEGLKWNPEDPHLKGNKEVAERWLNNKQREGQMPNGGLALKFRMNEPLDTQSMDIPSDVFVAIAIQMWKKNMEAGAIVRGLQLLDSVPEFLLSEEKIRGARQMTAEMLDAMAKGETAKFPSKPWVSDEIPQKEEKGLVVSDNARFEIGDRKLDILIWTGPAWEHWSPRHLDEQGIGGSETAAIHMGRQLAKLGHKVVQLGDHAGFEGTYEGVRYEHFQRGIDKPEDFSSDIIVCSRQPFMLDIPFETKGKFVWVHDIHVGQPSGRLTEQLFKADKFFCLSNWHKDFFLQTYSFLHKDSVIVTKNGIDLKRFEKEPKKIGNRLIYSSSPDRGLERLLELMPSIKHYVPDAELHVYYGFENWLKAAEMYNNQPERERIARFQRILEEQEKNGMLKYHGRVNQQEIADAFLSAKVWAYPTWFTETYCITAIEAEAGGCVPVSTALAALPETVSHGFLLRPPNTAKEYAEAFVNRIVHLMKNETERSRFADAGRKYAFEHHGWDKVAQSWETHFYGLLKEKASALPALPAFAEEG
jgi:glycosyltransferase involved in cell wall biosynthesis